MLECTLSPRSQHPLSAGCCSKCLECVAEQLLSAACGHTENTDRTGFENRSFDASVHTLNRHSTSPVSHTTSVPFRVKGSEGQVGGERGRQGREALWPYAVKHSSGSVTTHV